jgi:class 3 adenylate cyclase
VPHEENLIMNPYALPSIIAFALLLVLSLAVIFQNPRDKNNRFLFALCLNLALSVGAGGLLHLSTSESQANFWNRWPYIFGLPAYIFAIEYALQISGRSQRLKETLVGVPIAVHRWIVYGSLPFWLIVVMFTDLIISPAMFHTPTGWEHGYGPLFSTMTVYRFYLLLCQAFILYRGIKNASNSIEKKARIITFSALIGRDLFGFLIGMGFPIMGLQTHAFYGFVPIFMCILLTYGLLRMQWETIQDLKNGLEEKVIERTQALEAANERLQRAQQQISKYIDPNVTEKIFKGEFTAELSHERKKLTLFFSDIEDFTQFTDASDPEEVARLLNEYLGEMARIVRKWGGTIPQFTGDSVYAIFGAPDSRGEQEDAVACLRMALEMQQKMKNLQEKWWNQGVQFPFQIRCGIHTGMANVGNYGSEGFMEYSAIGLNTNLASRLEQACQPGEIYLSHSTWALVNEDIPCEEVGTIEVKGFHYPIQTYRVLRDEIRYK